MLNTLKTLSLAVLLGSGPAQAADAPLKIGTTAAFAPPLEVAVSEAGKQGLKVELVEFSDWNAPNITLAQGDIDANYFQHVPFLENANREGGFQLKPFAPGIINNVGLYSKRYASLAELPEGASVAIANDPINGGRGLQLLQKAGLLKLRDGVGYKATLDDIVDNPKDIRITELEAATGARPRRFRPGPGLPALPAPGRDHRPDPGTAVRRDRQPGIRDPVRHPRRLPGPRRPPGALRRHLPAFTGGPRRAGQGPWHAVPAGLGVTAMTVPPACCPSNRSRRRPTRAPPRRTSVSTAWASATPVESRPCGRSTWKSAAAKCSASSAAAAPESPR